MKTAIYFLFEIHYDVIMKMIHNKIHMKFIKKKNK